MHHQAQVVYRLVGEYRNEKMHPDARQCPMTDRPQTQFRFQGAKRRFDITQGPVQPGDAHLIPLAKRGSEQIHSSGGIALRPAFIELPPHLDGRYWNR